MTDLQQLADEAAKMCGWRKSESYFYEWYRGREQRCLHPFPVGDLNAIAEAWPEDEPLSLSYRKVRDGTQMDYRAVADRVWEDECGKTFWEAWIRLLFAVKRAEGASNAGCD